MRLLIKFYIYAALLLVACKPSHKPADAHPSSLVERLQAKEAAWLAELESAADKETGWLSLTDCDGTLWAGEATAAGHHLHLELAEYGPGEVHRRPQASGECWPALSASTVSNDMLTGYTLGLWADHDGMAMERLLDYGEGKGWVMGQPPEDPRTHYSPAGFARLARAAAALGSPKKDYAGVPDPCLPVEKDFEYHLQTLAILMDSEVSGKVSDLCLDALKRNAAAFPKDALMQAAYGVYSGDEGPALSLLTADTYDCPAYVRPVPDYCKVHMAYAGRVVLKRFGGT